MDRIAQLEFGNDQSGCILGPTVRVRLFLSTGETVWTSLPAALAGALWLMDECGNSIRAATIYHGYEIDKWGGSL